MGARYITIPFDADEISAQNIDESGGWLLKAFEAWDRIKRILGIYLGRPLLILYQVSVLISFTFVFGFGIYLAWHLACPEKWRRSFWQRVLMYTTCFIGFIVVWAVFDFFHYI